MHFIIINPQRTNQDAKIVIEKIISDTKGKSEEEIHFYLQELLLKVGEYESLESIINNFSKNPTTLIRKSDELIESNNKLLADVEKIKNGDWEDE